MVNIMKVYSTHTISMEGSENNCLEDKTLWKISKNKQERGNSKSLIKAKVEMG